MINDTWKEENYTTVRPCALAYQSHLKTDHFQIYKHVTLMAW